MLQRLHMLKQPHSSHITSVMDTQAVDRPGQHPSSALHTCRFIVPQLRLHCDAHCGVCSASQDLTGVQPHIYVVCRRPGWRQHIFLNADVNILVMSAQPKIVIVGMPILSV